jgi:hypothetical protein
MNPAEDITKNIITKVAIIVVVIVLLYFMVLRPILTKVGIIESKEDKERDKVAKTFGTAANSPFSPSYYKNAPAGSHLITRAMAEKLAGEINDAIGFFSDDENKVYGTLRQLQYKTQLSFLADVFFQKYKMDLYQLFQRNLSDSEIDVINNIATNLK